MGQVEGKDSFLVHSRSLCTRGCRRAPQGKSNTLETVSQTSISRERA